MRQITRDSVGISANVRFTDIVTGAPELGVNPTTPGIEMYYTRDREAPVPIVLAGIGNADPWTPGGFAEIGDGYYRIDVPDAAYAVGKEAVLVHGRADDMVVISERAQLIEEVAKQATVENLSVGSGSINVVASAFVLTTGTETNTFNETHALDGVFHQLNPAVGITDAYYETNIGGAGVPSSITWEGYAQGNGDTYRLYGYNWSTLAWEQIGEIAGITGTGIRSFQFNLTIAHVGGDANLGDVRVRVESTDGIIFATDRLTFAYSVVNESVGYANGAVWIDTLDGTPGVEKFINGTADNPVSTLADAKTIADSLGLKRFIVSFGSTITFVEDMSGYEFYGQGYVLNFGGQIGDPVYVEGAAIAGTLLGTVSLDGCRLLNGSNLPNGSFNSVSFEGDVTFSGTEYVLKDCGAAVSSGGIPTITLGAGTAVFADIFEWSGQVKVATVKPGDLLNVTGRGTVFIDSSCTGGTLVLGGDFTYDDQASGAVVISDQTRYAVDQLVTYASLVIAQGEFTGVPTEDGGWTTLTDADEQHDEALINITSGSQKGVCRFIDLYQTANGEITFDDPVLVAPIAGDTFDILPFRRSQGAQ